MRNSSITQLRVSVLELDFKIPITSALGTYTGSDYVVVELITSDSVRGYGYTTSLDRRGTKAVVSYIENELAPIAIGSSIDDPQNLWQKMWSPNKPRMRGGVGVHALSTVDIAVWDALAKTKNVPLVVLLGGAIEEVPVYGSGGWLSMDDSELVAEAMNFVEKGIKGYKIKIGGPRDIDRVQLLRQEFGGSLALYVDANQRYSVSEALIASRWLADLDVKWLEEPVLADCPWLMEEVAKQSSVPIAAGENVYFLWGFEDLCNREALRYIQPDVGRCGGITEWKKISDLASDRKLRVTSHLLHEVSASLVASSPAGFAIEYMDFFEENPFTHNFLISNGKCKIPNSLGHGVEFSSEAFAKYKV
ncbi:MAG: mandelate racemase/muconate lactonizing enzyme family protein [Pseudomonadota bacterium]|nr:mandelate racemase/muconate lactonizing enzyme family protein [Pseudomonadota bacterium]